MDTKHSPAIEMHTNVQQVNGEGEGDRAKGEGGDKSVW